MVTVLVSGTREIGVGALLAAANDPSGVGRHKTSADSELHGVVAVQQ